MDGRILCMRENPSARILYIEACALYVLVGGDDNGKPGIVFYPAEQAYQAHDEITTYRAFIEKTCEWASTIALPEDFAHDLTRCFTLMTNLVDARAAWAEKEMYELAGNPEAFLQIPQPSEELLALQAKEPQFVMRLHNLLTSRGSLQ